MLIYLYGKHIATQMLIRNQPQKTTNKQNARLFSAASAYPFTVYITIGRLYYREYYSEYN